jgi:hypothetical protein
MGHIISLLKYPEIDLESDYDSDYDSGYDSDTEIIIDSDNEEVNCIYNYYSDENVGL